MPWRLRKVGMARCSGNCLGGVQVQALKGFGALVLISPPLFENSALVEISALVENSALVAVAVATIAVVTVSAGFFCPHNTKSYQGPNQ